MKMTFLGKPDKRFPYLKTGKTYEVTIKKYGFSKFLHGVQVQMLRPITCPYASWESFYRNWREV